MPPTPTLEAERARAQRASVEEAHEEVVAFCEVRAPRPPLSCFVCPVSEPLTFSMGFRRSAFLLCGPSLSPTVYYLPAVAPISARARADICRVPVGVARGQHTLRVHGRQGRHRVRGACARQGRVRARAVPGHAEPRLDRKGICSVAALTAGSKTLGVGRTRDYLGHSGLDFGSPLSDPTHSRFHAYHQG